MSPMIKTVLEGLKRDGLQVLVGFTVLASFTFITYAVVYVKAANPDMANILFGSISTIMSGLVGYYFGTSKSSVDKTKLLAGKGTEEN